MEMVPGAATPVTTTYLFVSPANVTMSPASTVPEPLSSSAIGDGWRAVGRSLRCPLCVARYGVTRRRRGR